MPQNYIIEYVKPNIDKETNQQRADNYGNFKWYVKFQGEADTVPASFRTEPKKGEEKYGSIEEGQYGKYFKGAKNPNAIGFSSGKVDNSDGQKQGMCIKAAAEYVTQHSKDKLSPIMFAAAVEAYATALYNLELKKAEPANPDSAWEKQRAKAQVVKAQNESEPEQWNAEDLPTDDEGAIDISQIPF